MKHISIFFALIALLFAQELGAKDKQARSSERLRSMLANAPYSLVLFFEKDRQSMKDKVYKEKIVNMERMFRSLSKDSYYKDAQLQFIRADVSHGDMNSALKRYDVNQLPSFVTFLGRELKSILPGFAYRDAVEELIQKSLKSNMEETIKQADELRKKRLEEARIGAYNRSYWYPYGYWGGWGFGGPYWGGPYWRYGYGRPYGGFYFGW